MINFGAYFRADILIITRKISFRRMLQDPTGNKPTLVQVMVSAINWTNVHYVSWDLLTYLRASGLNYWKCWEIPQNFINYFEQCQSVNKNICKALKGSPLINVTIGGLVSFMAKLRTTIHIYIYIDTRMLGLIVYINCTEHHSQSNGNKGRTHSVNQYILE